MHQMTKHLIAWMSRRGNLVLVRLTGGIQTGEEQSGALRTAGPLPSTSSEAQGREAAHGGACTPARRAP